MKNLINHYNTNLFEPLAKRLPIIFGKIPRKTWREQLKVIDEIICALFDQRILPFTLSDQELRLMRQFLRDDFYQRKFGSRDAALLGSSELRKYIAKKLSNRGNGISEKRMIILSAHDTTITMLLTAMYLE
jgi:hypothetical protein